MVYEYQVECRYSDRVAGVSNFSGSATSLNGGSPQLVLRCPHGAATIVWLKLPLRLAQNAARRAHGNKRNLLRCISPKVARAADRHRARTVSLAPFVDLFQLVFQHRGVDHLLVFLVGVCCHFSRAPVVAAIASGVSVALERSLAPRLLHADELPPVRHREWRQPETARLTGRGGGLRLARALDQVQTSPQSRIRVRAL